MSVGAPETQTASLPVWLREVDNALVIAPHVVVAGNVLDFYLVGNRLARSVPEALWTVLEPAGYELLIVHDRVAGLSVRPATEEARSAAAELLGIPKGDPGAALEAGLPQCLRAVQQAPERRVALAVEQASRLLANRDSPDRDTFELFRLAERLATITPAVYRPGGSLYNVCFWIAQSERDLPDWFASANPRVRVVPLPMPEPDDRRTLATRLAQADPGFESLDSDEREKLLGDVVDSTGGLPLRAIEEIAQLAERHGNGFAGFVDASRAYRVGVGESPWQREDTRDRVRRAEGMLAGRVLGQDAAIRLSLDILTRSVTGLTGAHAGASSQRPRGVLFFAGPTGVGKTELAKALTELVFGSADRYVRFDMSEFNHEHADQRLIGSPPGYTGHDAGGELTNAVRRQPFSLVLFDEIEKAHPRILDKFLQVLDDGRLTDGAGGTVYFSEAIIVFTSNVGMARPGPDGEPLGPATPRDVVEATVRGGVKDYFTHELGRPELLNRLGENNIVVFQFITPEVADGIFEICLARVAARVETTQGIELVVSASARESLRRYAVADLSMGGRKIGPQLEHALVDPLARHVFRSPPARGSVVRVEGARETETGWELELA